MGILNVTPDSFSDGGKYVQHGTAVDHALMMIDNGADIIDVGGESTRPSAAEISVETEIERIVPVISELRKARPDIIISADTRKSRVAAAAVEAGADIINDISGLQFSPDMAKTAAEKNAGLIIMHMRGIPADMQDSKNLIYSDLLGEISNFLKNAAEKAIKAGVHRESIIIDPGLGFSKGPEQNMEICGKIDRIAELGFPVLAGHSRKSFIGNMLNEPDPAERIWGSAGVTAWLALKGAGILRVHDVKETFQLLKTLEKCKSYSGI